MTTDLLTQELVEIKENQEENKEEKKKKPSKAFVTRILVDLIDGFNDNLPPALKKYIYPHKYICFQSRPRDPNTILEVFPDKSCQVTCQDQIAHQIYKYCNDNFTGEAMDFHPDFMTCLTVVRIWPAFQKKIKKLPPAIGWKSTPGIVMNRLPFDPIEENIDDERLGAMAPTFADMLGRIENAEWLQWRLGSIFDPLADRKQAAFVHGPPDCGKSQLQEFLKRLCGHTYATLTAEDLKDKFWKANLVGSRVACVAEAAVQFLNTPAFLAVTGDSTHTINPKGTPAFLADIECMMFFFSNASPEIDSKDEIFLRVVSCGMTKPEITKDKILPTHEYQKLLENESRVFLSYCWQKYRSHSTTRFEPNMDTIIEASSDGEEWATAAFQRLFNHNPTSILAACDLRRILSECLRWNDNQATRAINIWKRRFGITKIQKRSKGGDVLKVYLGISPLNKDPSLIAFEPLELVR